jgi:Mu-like prophage I protein
VQLSADKAVIVELAGRLCLSNIRALAAAATSENNGRSGWVNLAMAGRWEGHPSGAFEFTPAVFSQIIANFKKNKTPVKFDYEHQTMNGQPGAKPASGHIKDLEMRDNGATLWGLVDWTPKAAEMIKAGEYNFCSPVVAFRSVDRKSGKEHGAELLQCALTDDPFLDGQQPIQLSFTAAGPVNPDDQKKPFPFADPAAQQPPPFPPQQMADPAVVPPPPDGLPMAAAPGEAPVPPPSADANLKPEDQQPPTELAEPPVPPDAGQADAQAVVNMLADATGSDQAGVLAAIQDHLDEVVGVIQKAIATDGTAAEMRKMSKPLEDEAEKARRIAAIEAGQKDATIVALSKKVEELSQSFSKIQADADARAKREVETQVDGLIATGHVEQAKREDAVWLFSTDPKRAASIYANKIVPIATPQAGVEPNGNAQATAAATVGTDGKVNVHALSRTQAVAYKSLVERYNGDETKASKMFSKLSVSKDKEAVH